MNLKSYLFILTALILIEIPRFLCQDRLYETCSQPFRCGNIGDISYPFFGGNRPLSCGYPGFELDCRGSGDAPLINISSLSYRVLDIENDTHAVRVSRQDLTPCPAIFVNTSLDFSIFNYSSSPTDRNITLFYGCPPIQIPPNPNQYRCRASDNDNSGIYAVGYPSLTVGIGAECTGNIFATVNETAAESLENIVRTGSARDVLVDALASGFTIDWYANNSNCEDCMRSGGFCGYEESSSSFACHCSDRTYPSICSNRNGNGGNSQITQRNIGLIVAGAVLAGFGLGWIIFFCRQKRKKKLLAKSSQVVSKEITPPLSSNGPLTPSSTVSTKSIPSLQSSKSNFSRQESAYFGVQVFSYTELEEATDSFNDSKELGEGGFGRVYYGVLSDGRVVAVKRLYENNFKRVEQFMNEVEILTRLRHENLVLLHGCTSKRSRELLLVYEYIPNGTVACHLFGKRSNSGLLSWPVRLNIAVESASALAYLHKSDIIHRDVKTNNILLDNDFHVKVADFGLSRLFPTDVTHVSTAPQGTPGYVDPEYYQCYHLTEKSDVYSFGVVLIELISSLPAVDTNRHRHDINLATMAVNKIQNHVLHELVDPTLGFETNNTVRRMTTLVAELAFRCLQQERDMRPSMDEVLETLKGIQNEDLNAHKVDIFDISMDEDAALLKGSGDTDSEATEKWTSGSNPNSIV